MRWSDASHVVRAGFADRILVASLIAQQPLLAGRVTPNASLPSLAEVSTLTPHTLSHNQTHIVRKGALETP